MSNNEKNRKQNTGCEHCDNLIAIGEGDHICLEIRRSDGVQSIMPISDYVKTDEYMKCRGKYFVER